MTTILGINRTSDASLCLLNDTKVMAIAKERLTRKKHDWGKLGDLKDLYLKRYPEFKMPVDLVVECYSSDKEIKDIASYREEIIANVEFKKDIRIIQMSHHLAHVYSAFFPSPFEEAAVMVYDFQGSHAKNMTEEFPDRNEVDPEAVEVISYYSCSGRKIECLGKQFWNGDHKDLRGLGGFYALLTHSLFPGNGTEGIVMGLAPYGDAAKVSLPPLTVEKGHITIPNEWLNTFSSAGKYSFFINGEGSFEDAANFAAAGQQAFEEALLKCVEWLRKVSGKQNLIVVGGCALNCSANARLMKDSSYKEIFVPAATHDAGTSLGCALYGLINVLNESNTFKWEVDYLGPQYDIDKFISEVAGHEDIQIEKPVDLAESISDLLIKGEVIAIFDGGSEFGPRALGHRSILADARFSFITNYINDKIKKRQWFRPLSPMVLSEDVQKYFNFDKASPFMLFAVDVKPEMIKEIPAVVHIDNSARIQTITKKNNPIIHALLAKYKEKTGVSVILNTSFNGKTEPIVETPEDALNCFLTTPLNKLIMPPYIIGKKTPVANPRRS